MTDRDIETFKSFFADYVKSFYSADPEDQKNISLKEEHSLMVCRTIRRLAGELELSRQNILLAEAIGLLHDIGRFSQYARYRTFRDGISVNHGVLGADILVEKDVLRTLPQNEQRVVLNAVRFHNAFAVPNLPEEADVFFLRLIKDSDKLDIWRILLGFLEDGKGEMTAAVGYGLPETPGYSEEAAACLRQGKSVSHSLLRNLNDFVLMQLSWVYDLNFPASYRLLAENDFAGRLFALLPDTPEVAEIETHLCDHAALMQKTSPADRVAWESDKKG